MIYAIYLNPTIDKTVYLDELKIGGTNRPDTVDTGRRQSSKSGSCGQPFGRGSSCQRISLL